MSDGLIPDGHGGRIDEMRAAFPDAPEPWIDLSTGINPFAYPVPPLDGAAWQRLPSAAERQACERVMASAFGCPESACRAVAGTEVAIRQLPLLLTTRRVAMRQPSYADHAESWARAGADLLFSEDPLAAVGGVDTVVAVNPNNPDGRVWSREVLEQAHASVAAKGGWLIVDEAYGDLEPERSMAPLAGSGGLIVLRSFGKFFGLAGARLGAVLAPPDILAKLGDRLGGWDVSGPALAIGTAAYADTGWQVETRAHLAHEANRLRELLGQAGLQDQGGTDLFRYVRAPDAAALWERLARLGIAVRPFRDDPHHLRIGLPAGDAAWSRLAEALSP